jgi:hypothetical protein
MAELLLALEEHRDQVLGLAPVAIDDLVNSGDVNHASAP